MKRRLLSFIVDSVARPDQQSVFGPENSSTGSLNDQRILDYTGDPDGYEMDITEEEECF